MKNKQKQKLRKKREVMRDLLKKNVKDLKGVPSPHKGPATAGK
ncbi:hypothetical protein [Salsuginibacillus kocurii]|nr:hypothetical protein [Salsuginibacillus kocurii]